MRAMQHIILAFSLMVASTHVSADDEAIQLLERMGTAAKTLNYDGVFAFQAGKKLQSVRIIHRADERGEVERVLSLNGAAREVIRTNDVVTWICPEGRRVNVNRRPLGRGFPSDLLSRLSSATPYYKVTLGQQDRVADRLAQELIITPVDEFRYGYHLWVDAQNDLLLKSELVSQNKDVLETLAFSSVAFDIDISDELLQPQTTGHEMTWNRTEQQHNNMTLTKKGRSLWQVSWLPQGFVLVAQQNRLKTNTGQAVEHRVYSDGLSSISVFIEPINAQHKRHFKGGSKMGAMNAFGSILNAHFLTVVGEVPEKTVEKVGNSIAYESRTTP